jgi:hypothetical protein
MWLGMPAFGIRPSVTCAGTSASGRLNYSPRGTKLQGLHLPDADLVQFGNVGEAMLRLVLAGDERKAVFAMKLVHWCEPFVLPPLDSEVWNAINDLTGNAQRWPGMGHWTADACVQSWRRALDFYADALAQLSEQSGRDLAEFDLRTQPPGYRRGNTLVQGKSRL